MANPEVKKKQQMEYMTVGVLIVIALLVGVSRFKKKDNDDEVFSRKKFNEQWKEVQILEESVPKKEFGVNYFAGLDETPFKGPMDELKKVTLEKQEEVFLPTLNVQGMVWNSARPQVIINGAVYDINDAIILEGAEGKIIIRDVLKEGIHLRYMGQSFMVKPRIELKGITTN